MLSIIEKIMRDSSAAMVLKLKSNLIFHYGCMRCWRIVFLTICEQLADKIVDDNRTLQKGKFRVNLGIDPCSSYLNK
jgi:hypothetical protein